MTDPFLSDCLIVHIDFTRIGHLPNASSVVLMGIGEKAVAEALRFYIAEPLRQAGLAVCMPPVVSHGRILLSEGLWIFPVTNHGKAREIIIESLERLGLLSMAKIAVIREGNMEIIHPPQNDGAPFDLKATFDKIFAQRERVLSLIDALGQALKK